MTIRTRFLALPLLTAGILAGALGQARDARFKLLDLIDQAIELVTGYLGRVTAEPR